MEYSDIQLREMIKEAVERALKGAAASPACGCAGSGFGSAWMFDDANQAVAAAKASQKQLAGMTLEKRGLLIAAMRQAALKNAEYLAKLANEETAYGRYEHKILKNRPQKRHPESKT